MKVLHKYKVIELQNVVMVANETNIGNDWDWYNACNKPKKKEFGGATARSCLVCLT